MLKQAPAIIAVSHGPSHVLELISSTFLRAVGRDDAESFLGKTVREALPELQGQGFFDLFDQVYASGAPFAATEMSARFIRGTGGADRFFSFVLQPLRGETGEVEGPMAHATVVTQLVMARRGVEQLASENARLYEQAQAAVRVRDDFPAVAAHELKTPLTALQASVQAEQFRLDRLGAVDPDPIHGALTRIDRQARKLGEMIGKLLDISRIDAVRDHGLGIPTSKRAHHFDRFFRAHQASYPSGLGLGLFISRQMAELHGGHLDAEFPEDVGSRIVLSLPLVPQFKPKRRGPETDC